MKQSVINPSSYLTYQGQEIKTDWKFGDGFYFNGDLWKIIEDPIKDIKSVKCRELSCISNCKHLNLANTEIGAELPQYLNRKQLEKELRYVAENWPIFEDVTFSNLKNYTIIFDIVEKIRKKDPLIAYFRFLCSFKRSLNFTTIDTGAIIGDYKNEESIFHLTEGLVSYFKENPVKDIFEVEDRVLAIYNEKKQ